MAEDYKEYFGVATTPDNFERLLYLATQELTKVIPGDLPEETDDEYEDYEKALLEQIKYFDDNEDLLSMGGSGYSLGKFKEGTEDYKVIDNKISPASYTILLNAGLLYVGKGWC